MPLYDAEKLWRSERRKRTAAENSGFAFLSVGAVVCAGLCGFVSPVEHYCGTLAALTLAMIAVLRLVGGRKIQQPLIVAEVTLALIYFELSDDLFAVLPFSVAVRYWAFGLAAIAATGVWVYCTLGHDPRDTGAEERAEISPYAAVIACTLLWMMAAHYIPRHY